MRSVADLESIWRYCTHHRDLIVRSDQAGCFHRGAIFPATEITEWIDEQPAKPSGTVTADGVTALCPRCGMDAVLPSATVTISTDLLVQITGRRLSNVYEALGTNRL